MPQALIGNIFVGLGTKDARHLRMMNKNNRIRIKTIKGEYIRSMLLDKDTKGKHIKSYAA
jgi:hypothetical protein